MLRSLRSEWVLNKREKCFHHVVRCCVIPNSHSSFAFKSSFWKLSKPRPRPPHCITLYGYLATLARKWKKFNWLDIIRDFLCCNPSGWFRSSSSCVITCAGLRSRVRAKAAPPRCVALLANIFPFQRASKQHRFTFTLSAFSFIPTDCDISFNLNLYPRICHLQNLFFPFCLSSAFVELKN